MTTTGAGTLRLITLDSVGDCRGREREIVKRMNLLAMEAIGDRYPSIRLVRADELGQECACYADVRVRSRQGFEACVEHVVAAAGEAIVDARDEECTAGDLISGFEFDLDVEEFIDTLVRASDPGIERWIAAGVTDSEIGDMVSSLGEEDAFDELLDDYSRQGGEFANS